MVFLFLLLYALLLHYRLYISHNTYTSDSRKLNHDFSIWFWYPHVDHFEIIYFSNEKPVHRHSLIYHEHIISIFRWVDWLRFNYIKLCRITDQMLLDLNGRMETRFFGLTNKSRATVTNDGCKIPRKKNNNRNNKKWSFTRYWCNICVRCVYNLVLVQSYST